MSGRRVIALVTLILIATVVVPPLAATGVNRLRVKRASTQAEELRRRLESPGSLPDVPEAILRGLGDWPRFEGAAAALADRPRASFPEESRLLVAPDPWGNALIAILDENGAAAPRWYVVSAGPDGIVTSAVPHAVGDDIVAAR